jgi:protein-S-isoprenylcysteine O-methyltransferase Ste14
MSMKRHLMPMVAMATFVAAAAPAGRAGLPHLVLGTVLMGLYWLVEWLGIEGTFQNRVPRHPLILASRALWPPAFALAVVDAQYLHWTPWQGAAVRGSGVALFAAGLGLRLWSMRTLKRAFSYDLKVTEDQALVTSGPYRVLRHPSYTGLILWSAACAVWNPSVPGLALMLAATVPQIVYRIRIEERILAEHFGARWTEHAKRTWRLVPGVW